MIVLAAWIAAGTLVLGFCRLALIWRLRRLYYRPPHVWPADQPFPKVAIVLSLRGHDPYLKMCLSNLMGQKYPNFIVRVVVDSATDPAWAAIRAIQDDPANDLMKVSVLQHHDSSCSLKNSSIIQAIRELPEDCEIVVFVDADAITHPTWLCELVAPLADMGVACTTGVRWFAPHGGSFADRLRCYWNLIAAAMIYQTEIPWGGSMAIRRSVLDSGLTDAWSRMFCEDAFTIAHLRRRGLKLVCVPQATIVNEECTTLQDCFKFVSRQTLIFRLYHRAWWGVATVVESSTILRCAQIHLAAQSLYRGEWISFLLLVVADPIILFATLLEADRLDWAVRNAIQGTGRSISSNPASNWLGYFAGEILVLSSTLYALCARHVTWRGITYRVKGPTEITMLAYRPFTERSGRELFARTTVL